METDRSELGYQEFLAGRGERIARHRAKRLGLVVTEESYAPEATLPEPTPDLHLVNASRDLLQNIDTLLAS